MAAAVKLADQEKADVAKRAQELGEVIKAIDAALIKYNVTLGEFGEMLTIFQQRDEMVVKKLTIKEIKEKFL